MRTSIFLTFIFLPLISQANSRSLFYNLSQKQAEYIHSFDSDSGLDNQLREVKKSFSSFIRGLLQRDIEISKIGFEPKILNQLSQNNIKHIKVPNKDIISSQIKKSNIWIKPYIRDIYFQTRSMVCKYSYRSKFVRPSKSLSGHFVHQNLGSLYCRDIENGAQVKPYVFGSKSQVFITEISKSPQNQRALLVSKTVDSKRNKTLY